MHGRDVILGHIKIRMDLVVEEDMRSQSRQYPVFVHPAQEERLVGGNVPFAQG